VAIYYQNKDNFNGTINTFGGEHSGEYNENFASPGTVYCNNLSKNELIIAGQDQKAEFNLSKDLTGLDIIKFNNVTINPAIATNLESQDLIMNSAILKTDNQEIINFNANNFSLINSTIKANINLTAQNLNIDDNSLVLADAKGYISDAGPGTGQRGMGGSYGGKGGKNATSSIYGSLTQPTDLGSGGGGNPEGVACFYSPAGTGGGSIILKINKEMILEGNISADGQDGHSSPCWGCGAVAGGSGGSVYITTENLKGSGTIKTNGGNSYMGAGAGGGGRIAIYGDRINFSGIIESIGGQNQNYSNYSGQEGTIYFSQ